MASRQHSRQVSRVIDDPREQSAVQHVKSQVTLQDDDEDSSDDSSCAGSKKSDQCPKPGPSAIPPKTGCHHDSEEDKSSSDSDSSDDNHDKTCPPKQCHHSHKHKHCCRHRQGPPGWKPNTSYSDGDIVTYDCVIYRCIRDHTSSPVQPPPYATGSWQPATGKSGSTGSPSVGVGNGQVVTGTNVEDLKLPYASELFGVYQPLVGWKSQLAHETLSTAIMKRIQEATRHAAQLTQSAAPRILKLRAFDRTGTVFGSALASQMSNRRAESVNDLLSEQTDAELGRATQTRSRSDRQSFRASDTQASDEEEGPVFGPVVPQDPREIATAAVLRYLSTVAPDAVTQAFHPPVSKLDRTLGAAKFFAGGHPSKDVYLSPIGLLHQFREYFFQLGTFLGPPVGHVWISPGGSVELVEVNTRRKLVEQTIEQSTTTVNKSESSTTDRDELSDAVKTENSNDMKLGASASASGGIGPVFQASGTASFNLDVSRRQAQEQTHKKMREQSAKLTSEVTQNYKTTFRTVTETTDTSSRRYVLQNTTNRLVSYELSRKMRKVGVQVQDLGQRLCFQLFVENPGNRLGVGEFVHATAASLDPNIKPPEEQPIPGLKIVTVQDNYPYINSNPKDDRELSSDFWQDPDNPDGGLHPEGGNQSRIDFKRDFKLPPGPEDYDFVGIRHIDFKGAAIKVKDPPEFNATTQMYTIRLTYANFGGKEMLPFDMQVDYQPSETLKARVNKKNEDDKRAYDDQVAEAKEKIFYDTLRTRLKLAGSVRSRSYDVLREEERNLIYSNIIKTLYGDESGFQREDYYAASEMIRYLFDVDALLYFVAPDWWKPESFQLVTRDKDGKPTSSALAMEPLSTRAALQGVDVRAQVTRPTYLMTEETEPARMGASLGWLMQIDGDTQRNAFLNSPWVKAVLPIRPGREKDALDFLESKEVAGSDGLQDDYPYQEGDPEAYKYSSYRKVLLLIADKIAKEYNDSFSPVPVGKPAEGGIQRKALPAEVVFAHGFDPLEGGIRFDRGAFKVFSEWTEVLPTDQVVATEYSLQGL